VINVLNNSIESMEEKFKSDTGMQLVITSEVKDNKLILNFKDNGIGISDNNKENIFKPLFTTKTKGIGLGMNIIQQVMQQQKGEIKIESEEGKGATISLILPMIK